MTTEGVTMDAKTKSAEGVSNEEKKQKRKRLKKVLSDIQKQLEFYFGDSNLRKDRFIKQEMEKADDGCIDVSVIANFNRMQLLTKDPSLIVRAMENCDLLEVSEDKKRVKRKNPPKKPKYDENDLTVYVENLPHNVDLEMLRKMFSPCGNIAYISIPKYRYTRDTKGFAFVEFTTPDEAANACKLLDNPTTEKPLDGRFPLTRKGRLILTEPTLLKRKRETSEATQDVEEGAQLEKKSKRKSTASREVETKTPNKKDAQTPKEQKSAKKRKQSGEDDRLDFEAKSAQKDKANKRRRDESISSVDSVKEKSRKEAGIAGGEAKRTRTDSEALGGEDGDKKKKRSRGRKHKRDELEAPVLQIRVIPKKNWLELKKEYLAMQKTSRKDMKKVLQEKGQNGHKQKKAAAVSQTKSTEPEFVPGVVLKIDSNKPFASRKNVREQIQEMSPVAYVDLKDGDKGGFVRLESAEGAKAVLEQASKLKNEDVQFKVTLLSGEDEDSYWKKLKLDRVSKLNQARRKKKKRGVDRILDKTEKASGLTKSKKSKGHKQFE
ncbi:la-related protein 7-like [Asterias rubens]|uniref:la-related protein 7-like n=1 Tax=Asterias rubens TaxID=7604 RepID=UPI00145530E4|nr:la-related protein 7-like [Asterias rubens]